MHNINLNTARAIVEKLPDIKNGLEIEISSENIIKYKWQAIHNFMLYIFQLENKQIGYLRTMESFPFWNKMASRQEPGANFTSRAAQRGIAFITLSKLIRLASVDNTKYSFNEELL